MIDTNLNTFNYMYAALKKPKLNFALKLYTLFFNGTTSTVRQWDPFKSYLFSTIKLFLLANVKPLWIEIQCQSAYIDDLQKPFFKYNSQERILDFFECILEYMSELLMRLDFEKLLKKYYQFLQ